MNSIWLILLLLFFCNGDGCGNTFGNCGNCRNRDCDDRMGRRDCDCDDRMGRRDCDCDDRMGRRDCDRDDRMDCGCPGPFSNMNRRDRDFETEFPPLRGTGGPCGCEENKS